MMIKELTSPFVIKYYSVSDRQYKNSFYSEIPNGAYLSLEELSKLTSIRTGDLRLYLSPKFRDFYQIHKQKNLPDVNRINLGRSRLVKLTNEIRVYLLNAGKIKNKFYKEFYKWKPRVSKKTYRHSFPYSFTSIFNYFKRNPNVIMESLRTMSAIKILEKAGVNTEKEIRCTERDALISLKAAKKLINFLSNGKDQNYVLAGLSDFNLHFLGKAPKNLEEVVEKNGNE